MRNPTADQIREYVAATYITPARLRGEKLVQITAGDIHKALHLHNVIPNVCQVLKGPKFLKEHQLEIENLEGPPSGMGSKLKITYRLMGEASAPSSIEELPLLRLLGIGKEVFKSLGGAEAFIRREREQFYGDREEP